jgi:hypothetical protein
MYYYLKPQHFMFSRIGHHNEEIIIDKLNTRVIQFMTINDPYSKFNIEQVTKEQYMRYKKLALFRLNKNEDTTKNIR